MRTLKCALLIVDMALPLAGCVVAPPTFGYGYGYGYGGGGWCSWHPYRCR